MTTCILAFVIAFLAALGATRMVRAFAMRVGAVDIPDDYRKRHHGSVPRLGGIAIFVAFLAPLAGIAVFNPYIGSVIIEGHEQEALGCILGGAMALLVGVLDDFRDIRARYKLVLQLIPALAAFVAGCSITAISLPFVGSVDLGWLSLPVTLFWFLTCMNAINFLDGLDGLAAGVALFVTLTLFLAGIMFENIASTVLMACLSGAILGFLLFNFHPARIFLGDSGSMLLGFLIAALSLQATRKAETAVALLIPVIALGLPITDTALAVFRRWWRKLPLETADRQHIHHRLIGMGFSHRRAVLALYSVCVALGLSAVLVTLERSEVTILVLGTLAVLVFVCVRVFGRVTITELMTGIARNRKVRLREMAAAAEVERAVQVLPEARDLDAVWRLCTPAFDQLELDSVRMQLNGSSGNGGGDARTWSRNGALDHANGHDCWSARLYLRRNGFMYGHVELRQVASRHPLLPDTPRLLSRLLQEVSHRVEHLDAAATANREERP
jgi:UDP-GlcNAc:undecaprenyl-phosphate GlcNAc-1-phosphate transferase